MAICPANMRECDPKEKCLFGPNAGKAYNPKSPCCGQGVFNEATCDCDSLLPTGEVQFRITGGNMTDGHSPDPCSGSIWATILSAPYVDPEGRLIQFDFSTYANWGCKIPSLIYTACDAWGSFPTSFAVKKEEECGGGSSLLIAGVTTTYIDGEQGGVSPNYSFQLHTSCIEGSRGTYCDNEKYGEGFGWTAGVEYRVSDGEGGWNPL